MSFVEFLKGGIKILVVGSLTVLFLLAGGVGMAGGKPIVGVPLLLTGGVGGMYVIYERAQQRKRLR